MPLLYRKSYKNKSKCLKTGIISLRKKRTEVYLHSFLTIRRAAIKRIIIVIFVPEKNIKLSSEELKLRLKDEQPKCTSGK